MSFSLNINNSEQRRRIGDDIFIFARGMKLISVTTFKPLYIDVSLGNSNR